MVRTRDSAGTKAVGAKAPRKVTGSTSASSASASSKTSDSAKNKYAGGNPYFPRETPAWQKPITAFFASGQGESSHKENNSGQVNISKNIEDDAAVCSSECAEHIGNKEAVGEDKIESINEGSEIMEDKSESQNLENSSRGKPGLDVSSSIQTIDEGSSSSKDIDMKSGSEQMDSEPSNI